MDSFGHTAGRAVRWLAVAQIGKRVAQVATTAVLAHLLSARDFGMIGMAAVIIDFAIIFRDLGTTAAIIQRESLNQAILSTVFWANLAFGLSVALLIGLVAPLVAVFFNEPGLTSTLRVLAVVFVIASASILQQALLERDLAFERLAKLEILSALLGAAAGILCAYRQLGVWSLVAQAVVTQSAQTFLLWRAGAWRPSIEFHWEHLAEIRRFSLNLTGSQLLGFVLRNADNVLIGRYLGSTALGYYSIAYRIMLYPLQSVSHVAGRALLPVYARLKRDDARFRGAYTRATGAIAMLTFPMMAGIMVLREPFVQVVLGSAWKPVEFLLLILAPVGMAQSVATTTGMIYQTTGRTDLMFRWGLFSCSAAVGAFVLGLRWGVEGVAICYAALNFLLFYPSFAIPFRLIELPWREFLRPLAAPLLASLAMAVSLWLGLRLISGAAHGGVFQLAASALFGAIVYITALLAMGREQIRQVWRTATVRAAA